MSQVYVAGPAEIHVSTGTAGALQFLGWSMQGVRIDIVGEFLDVPNDLAGSNLPLDVQQMGQQAYISADVNLYNEGIYRKIANRARITDGGPDAAAGSTEGDLVDYGMGFLMKAESRGGASGAFGLLVFCPYGGGVGGGHKPNFTTMDHGYHFSFAYLDDAATIEVGSRYKKIRMVFRALTSFAPSTRYSGLMYNHNTSGRVAID